MSIEFGGEVAIAMERANGFCRMQELKEGKVSGRKLVAVIGETPGL